MQTDYGNTSTVNTERELVIAQQPVVQQNQAQQYPPQQNPAYAQPQQAYYQQQPPQQYAQPQYGAPQQQMAQPQPMSQPMGQQMVPQIVQLTQYPSNAEGCRSAIVIQCPYCRQVGTTRVTHVAGNKTYCYSCLLCFTLPCLVCVPCCVDSCQRVQSFCQHCAKQVGTSD